MPQNHRSRHQAGVGSAWSSRSDIILIITETGMLDIREIPLGPHMTKYHFQQPGIPAMHHMRAPDHGDPHDHPFGFPSFILFGGYREEVFELDGTSYFLEHRKGESFYVPAKRIHRIVELFEGECWTITLPGPFEQEWGSWQFRPDGAYKRVWGQPEFERVHAA